MQMRFEQRIKAKAHESKRERETDRKNWSVQGRDVWTGLRQLFWCGCSSREFQITSIRVDK